MFSSRAILPRVARCAAMPARPLSTSAILRHKESSSQTDDDVDKHKLDSLRKQQTGGAHWKPELASDSEEAVKADKAHGAAKESVEQLQERTKKAAEESAKKGTSHQEGM